MSYHVPYSGSYTFQSRVSLPTANLAVALPSSMKLAATARSSFQPLDDTTDAQTFLAKNVQPSQTVGFTISGNGSLPRDAPEGQQDQGQLTSSASAAGPVTDTRPGIGLGAPIDTPDPLDKYKWWLLSGLGVIFVIAAAFFLRSKGTTPTVTAESEIASPSTRQAAASQTTWLGALKDQLFLLRNRTNCGQTH